MQASRRAFFAICGSHKRDVIRPPWALPEAKFIENCTRCSACIDLCPTRLLVKGSGGFPEADFTPGRATEGCTFCGNCLAACQESALIKRQDQAAWTLQAVFGESCLAAKNVVCRTCGEACEAQAINFLPRLGGVSRPQLKAEACNGCGACLADCPTQAISLRPDLSLSIATQGAT